MSVQNPALSSTAAVQVCDELGPRNSGILFAHVVLIGRNDVAELHGQHRLRGQSPVKIKEVPPLLALEQGPHFRTQHFIDVV